MKRRLLLFIALVLAPGPGCAPTAESGDWPNVLLITIDTLRRDHCSVYGYAHDTTPHLRRVAEGGLRFDLAYAPTPTTGPTHASILTGLYPPAHRVVKNGVALAARNETLAEILAAQGYQTSGIVSSFVLHARFGFGQGFSVYQDDFEAATASASVSTWEGQDVEKGFDRRADATTRRAIRWLWEDRDRERPFFLFVHYFDPHSPYEAPGAFAQRFPPPDPGAGEGIQASLAFRQAVRNYDGEIAFTDQEIGRLLDAIERQGLSEKTLVVITADHGEGLMDHGAMLHGLDLYEENVRVPLLLRWPDRIPAGRVLAQPVELVDLAPTILDLIGVKSSRAFQGRSLAASLRGDEPLDPDRPIYLHRRRFDAEYADGIYVKGRQFGIRWGRWKTIDAPDQGRTALYDLESDPQERTDRSRSDADQAARLAEKLMEWRRSGTSDPAFRGLSESDREALEALGYSE
ncbi:MAG: sulfatase-like hydrolase/transferase [Myxococcales bacterium]|nr:sulfatase-like hydrolase/transferase [Myxococcales bacterium]